MNWHEWYQALSKPDWTPAPATITLIWSLLYPVILLSFGFVFIQGARGQLPRYVWLPFALNLVVNLAFMPLFAVLQEIILATGDIVLVWITLLWSMVAIWPYYRGIAVLQVPYLMWVSTASVLQFSIAWLNRF